MTATARRIREGDLRALARTATGVENRDPESLAVLREIIPFGGHAHIVGITGPPGAGKSTLVDALAKALRERGQTVAILAVDPSSRATGGAILGDRIRMSRHYADPGIFIRSMATRGSVGGLAEATRDMALLMDAAGHDYVLIETVGVGQDEIEIAGLAGTNVVVQAPGMGDDVQALKAGILEIADIFVINKADQPGAERVEQELRAALSLAGGPHAPIVLTVATDGKGVDKLLDLLGKAFHRAGRVPATPDWLSSQGTALAPEQLHHAVAFYAAPGLHPKSVSVPDLAAAAAQLTASGGRLLNRPTAGASHLYVFVESASVPSVLLELTQESAS
jgi:LAO/AO transport system kinase